MLLQILLLICGLFQVQSLSRVDPLVSTKMRLIRGLRSEKGYSKFLGVPYGLVDETQPFGPSSPHPKFETTFEAYEEPIVCPQIYNNEPIGSLQCLNMNIYVPESANARNKLPVMVWIHGGAFVEGDSYREGKDPYSLLRNEVIVVAINYRHGVYGFMCLDIPEVPGNQGLKDQTLALRWIKENIEAFGGDDNKITIFGESAGGMSVNMHLFSEFEILYNNAIIQSGPALSYWMMVESDKTVPFRLAEDLGYNATDINDALSYLSTIDAQKVVRVAYDLNIANSYGNNQPLTKPCVEQKFEGIENFITEHPMNINSNKVKSIPIIIGHNDNEFAFQYAVGTEFLDTYDITEQFNLGFDMNNDLKEALDTIRHYYLGDEGISEKVRWEIIKYATDFIFIHPSQRMAEKLVESNAKNVYRYVFSYNGGRNVLNIEMNLNATGAVHSDELGYLFDLEIFGDDNSPEDQLVVDRITKLWTNFAKYGDPTPETSELIPVKWEPITKSKQPYLDFNSELSLKNRPFKEDMAFWDLFYKQYGKYQKWYKEPASL